MLAGLLARRSHSLSRHSCELLLRFQSSWLEDAERWRSSLDDDGTTNADNKVTPITVVTRAGFPAWRAVQSPEVASWLDATIPTVPKPRAHFFIPNINPSGSAAGSYVRVVFVTPDVEALDGDDGGLASPWAFSSLPSILPAGRYAFDPPLAAIHSGHHKAALSWALGSYQFRRYKLESTASGGEGGRVAAPGGGGNGPFPSNSRGGQAVLVGERMAGEDATAATATFLVRDMITTPAEDCGPAQIEAAARSLADQVNSACEMARVGVSFALFSLFLLCPAFSRNIMSTAAAAAAAARGGGAALGRRREL